jgi:hypothetical protein
MGQKGLGVSELERPAWYLGQGLLGLTRCCGDTLEGELRTNEPAVV